MPHIHTKSGQHDHTATAYIIRTDGDEPRALLHMHKKLGRLLAVGGHIELDETPWAAMAHELREEAGYTLHDLDVLQPYNTVLDQHRVTVHPLPFCMNTHEIPADDEHWHSDISYLFVARDEPQYELAEGESTDLRWLTRDEVAELDIEKGVFEITQINYLLAFDSLLSSWHPIPAINFRTDKVT